MSRRTKNVLNKRTTLSEHVQNELPNAKKVVEDSKDLPHLKKQIKYLLK